MHNLQVIGPGMGDAYLKLKLGDQRRALEMVDADPKLRKLERLQSPLVDLEVHGIPALQYFGRQVWEPVLDGYCSGTDSYPCHDSTYLDISVINRQHAAP